MEEQKLSIIMHLDKVVINGTISLQPGVRLSDHLNSQIKFLKITDAYITNANGITDQVDEFYINKESITMLETKNGNVGRGIGAGSEKAKYPPYVEKTPVMTKIKTTEYEVNGQLHTKGGDGIERLLGQENTFLPCTEANVRDVNTNELWNTRFAAINRNKIFSLQKLAIY